MMGSQLNHDTVLFWVLSTCRYQLSKITIWAVPTSASRDRLNHAGRSVPSWNLSSMNAMRIGILGLEMGNSLPHRL